MGLTKSLPATILITALTLTGRAPAGEKADVRIDPVQARQAEESAKLQAALARKVSVEFEATPLADALVFIRTVGRVGLIVAPEVRDTDKQTVTLKLKEAPLRDVLDRVLGPAGLKWQAHQGSVRVSPAAAAGPAGEAEGAERECVEFVQTPASQVVSFVADRTGVNIVVDPKVREKLKTPVTFKTKGMTYRQVLDWALKLSGTAWTLTDGALYVTSQENVPKVDPKEIVRKFLADNPKLFEEPAKFEPPPPLDFPKMK